MLKAQQAEELRLMRDSEARRNDEFAVLLRQENERRAELDSKFSASETRRMHLERERIEMNARCDSLTQQVASFESQIERMRAQFGEQLQSALSEAASREARVAAQLQKALADNARLLDERNAEVCHLHQSITFRTCVASLCPTLTCVFAVAEAATNASAAYISFGASI